MGAIIPVVVGLGIAGAIAFAAGGSRAAAVKPATHRPKKKAPSVSNLSEQTIIAAMKNPAAIKKLIDEVAATGDPVKLWNLGRTMLLNSKGNPTMQAAAAAVLAKAVVMAFRGDPSSLIATALANGDAQILAGAAISATTLAPDLAARLRQLANQLTAAGKTPGPVKRKPTSSKPDKDDINAQKAATAATQVVADAIKATAQVEKDPPGAPVPNVPPTPVKATPVTLPEVIVEAKVPKGDFKVAIDFTSYLESLGAARDHTLRGKEDKKKVGQFQKQLGLSADGVYGPGSASKIAQLGWVPVPPFYWSKGKADSQKKAYKSVIALQSKQIPDLDWNPAVKNVDRS